jgi:hypothetical protein
MTRGRARAIFSHRSWTYGALVSAATALLALLYFDLLVAARVDCRTFKGPVSTVVQWLGAAAFVLAIPLLVLNGVRALLVRSPAVMLLSAGLIGAGAWLLMFTVDYTFAYCMFDGADLPPCLFGCAH